MIIRRIVLAVGVVILTFVARVLPAFVLPVEWSNWWLATFVGDQSEGMSTAYAAEWILIEIPILVPIGLACVWFGGKR